MPRDLSHLSIAEIRERYLRTGGSVSPALLRKLKRDSRRGVRQLYEVLRRRHEREREERLRLEAMLHFERVLWKSGVRRVAGVDEVGMGPLAGPVVAAAVVFPPGTEIEGIDDSKRLDPEQREELADVIRKRADAVAIGTADVEDIDRENIYRAGLLAMRRAVEALLEPPQHVLVDAREIPGLSLPQNRFSKGDGINFSIAAASIVAKTHRDALMVELDRRYPGYGFASHKGYATAEHQEAIRRLGPSPVHRMSFPFLRELRGEYASLFYELRRRLDAVRTAQELEAFEAELEAKRDGLEPPEHRKLRLLCSRRWNTALRR